MLPLIFGYLHWKNKQDIITAIILKGPKLSNVVAESAKKIMAFRILDAQIICDRRCAVVVVVVIISGSYIFVILTSFYGCIDKLDKCVKNKDKSCSHPKESHNEHLRDFFSPRLMGFFFSSNKSNDMFCNYGGSTWFWLRKSINHICQSNTKRDLNKM